MTRPAISFEGLLGHTYYLSNQIGTAVTQCFAAFPSWYQAGAVERACLNEILPQISDLLLRAPESSAVLRRFVEAPPDASLRTADADFDRLSEAQQDAVVAVMLNALLKWLIFRSVCPLDVLKSSPDGRDGIDIGENAFERLFALHCHLKQTGPTEEQHHLEEARQKWISGVTGQIVATSPSPVGGHMAMALAEFDELMAASFAIVDLARFGNAQDEPSIQDWFSSIWTEAQSVQSESERDKLLARATIARACQFRWREPSVPPRRVALVPSSDQAARRATRLLAMVHELHKAGYQRIRVSPGIGGPGFWRCNITAAGNIASDGFTIRSFDEASGLVAPYSSAGGSGYFGWPDAPALNARQMADRFLQAFPKIASAGAGRDWMYAGWLTDVLGRAEQGNREDLVTLYGDEGFDSEKHRPWCPPPPHSYT